MDTNVNPSEGTLDAVAQSILNKSAPENNKAEIEHTEPQGNPETEEAEDEFEADNSQEETEDTDEDSTEEATLYEVKVNGEVLKVPLDELIAGYSKDQDYRQKTAKLSEDRNLIEAEKQRIANEAKELADQKTIKENYLKELTVIKELTSKPPFTEEALQEILVTKGAEAYLQAQNVNKRHADQLKQITSQIEHVKTELTEDQKKELTQRETNEREALLTTLPELKDEANQQKLGKYLLDLGFNQDDITNTLDHRLFVIAEKARRLDEMMSKGKQKPVVHAPKVTKGNAPRITGNEVRSHKVQELSKQAKRSGSVDDLAKLLIAKNS